MAARTSNGGESLLARVTILPSQLTASPMFRLGAYCSHALMKTRRSVLLWTPPRSGNRPPSECKSKQKGRPGSRRLASGHQSLPRNADWEAHGKRQSRFAAVLMRSGLHPADARRVTEIPRAPAAASGVLFPHLNSSSTATTHVRTPAAAPEGCFFSVGSTKWERN
jgi:hypothetical protein